MTSQSSSTQQNWEDAYLRFETKEQEIKKFKSRLVKMGCQEWPVESRIFELFCGRGSGLHALDELGFSGDGNDDRYNVFDHFMTSHDGN